MSAYTLTLSRDVLEFCSPEEQNGLREHPEFLKLSALVAECEAQNNLLTIAEKEKYAVWQQWCEAGNKHFDPEPHKALTAYFWEQDAKEQKEKRDKFRRRVAAILAGETLPEPEPYPDPNLTDPRLAELEAAVAAEVSKRKAATKAESAALSAAEAAYYEVEKARDAQDTVLSDALEALGTSPLRGLITLQVEHW